MFAKKGWLWLLWGIALIPSDSLCWPSRHSSPGEGVQWHRERGWTKTEYRRGDVRDAAALKTSFEGADVVVHLAFLILSGGKETTRAINIEGTLNAFRAAAAVPSSTISVAGNSVLGSKLITS